ncbi:MAG: DUF5055 domain-containing protein [Ruminococcus sp.]|nr:DUF5055 domain-containing protein [Ruminococcus sp.]
MAKQIKFTDPVTDRELTLEFNRAAVRAMENAGFNFDMAREKPLNFFTSLFAGAFRMHHRAMRSKEIEALQENLSNKEELTEKLMEMYLETIESISSDKGDDEKNLITWTASF